MTHVLAIDQGTSATKCVLVDVAGKIVAKATAPLSEHYPAPGWVEQDPLAIWHSVCQAVESCLAQQPDAVVAAVGLSTQRESALLWERTSAKPVSPLLSWQDQRTVSLRDDLASRAGASAVRQRSGLPLDPMFSALKIRWLLDRFDPDGIHARAGSLCAGTVDAWVVSMMGGVAGIEVGNASRTQLLNVQTAQWDADLMDFFSVPAGLMPMVLPSSKNRGHAGKLHARLAQVPVMAVMADSHAALYAHGVRQAGDVKATMGTGSSVMGLTDAGLAHTEEMCQTIAWDDGSGHRLALEGNIRSAGATLKWAADLFGLDIEAAAAEAMSREPDGLWLVPGFSGLGAPHWDAHAVGLISGLTLSTDRQQLLAAAMDSIAHQIADVLEAMDRAAAPVGRLLLDGGPSKNDALRTRISAYIHRPVLHCADAELSALGVAHMAGMGVGLWTEADLIALPRQQFESMHLNQDTEVVKLSRLGWSRSVDRARLRPRP